MLNPTPNPKRDEDALDRVLAEIDVRPEEAGHGFARSGKTPEQAAERRHEAHTDFWAFDRTYFPPAVYTQGYAPPGDYHRRLVHDAQSPGVHVRLGPRKGGKSVTAKKLFAWLLLTARVHLGGVLSHQLDPARRILGDIRRFIQDNPRIAYDYEPAFDKDSEDEFSFRTAHNQSVRSAAAFSENRSVRSYARAFARPEFILGDDVETHRSSFEPGPVRKRSRAMNEAKSSLSLNGTFFILGNNLDRACLLNQYLKQDERGDLSPEWTVRTTPAWSDDTGSFWPERFPATSEAEMRRLLQPADDEEWNADFQQNPQPPAGRFFKSKHLQRFRHMPARIRGVLYCDPNLSKKGKGDTTAILALFYDPEHDRYLIPYLRCKSYSDSNALLDDVLRPKTLFGHRLAAIGFDGNVTQESTWSNNVRNWCRQRGLPYPYIEWCRYNVDDLAKNAQGAWAEGKIAIAERVATSQEGQEAQRQISAFTGRKRPSARDDAPDALICAFELLHDRLTIRPGQAEEGPPIVAHDPIRY